MASALNHLSCDQCLQSINGECSRHGPPSYHERTFREHAAGTSGLSAGAVPCQ
jgi:hypothetical protein